MGGLKRILIVLCVASTAVSHADVVQDLARARDAAKAGDWEQVSVGVADARADCQTGEAGKQCRALTGFNAA